MTAITRRTFLQGSGAAAASLGATALTAKSAEAVKGANDRINVAMVGCGGRGSFVIRGLIEAGAHVTHLCDLNPQRLAKCAGFLADAQKDPPKTVKDMQVVFDAKDVHAVVVATPDHWHAPAAIRACQAGKDVYVEKPHCHNIWESHQMVAAAEKYKRVVQVGTQNRSAAYNLQALEYVRSGKLGGVHLVKVYNMKSGGPFKLGRPGEKPGGFDWSQWLGPAAERPYHQNIFSRGWHHLWDFSGGDLMDDGIHQLDLALMLMGDPPLPKSVRCLGGRYAHKGDDSQRPDVQIANWDFGEFVMTLEVTGYPRYMLKTTGTIRRNDLLPNWSHNATRIELYGAERMMTVGRHGGGWIVQQSGGKAIETVFGRVPDPEHYRNFLACIRSRKPSNADIRIAHPSVVTAHMANIAHRAGDKALNFDAQTGRFDDAGANKLIKRHYRKGFEIPDAV